MTTKLTIAAGTAEEYNFSDDRYDGTKETYYILEYEEHDYVHPTQQQTLTTRFHP